MCFADVFDNEVDPVWRADLLDLIARRRTWCGSCRPIRIGNVIAMTGGTLPANVAIGGTMASQDGFDRDNRKLMAMKDRLKPIYTLRQSGTTARTDPTRCRRPDWIIVDGEGGRPRIRQGCCRLR